MVFPLTRYDPPPHIAVKQGDPVPAFALAQTKCYWFRRTIAVVFETKATLLLLFSMELRLTGKETREIPVGVSHWAWFFSGRKKENKVVRRSRRGTSYGKRTSATAANQPRTMPVTNEGGCSQGGHRQRGSSASDTGAVSIVRGASAPSALDAAGSSFSSAKASPSASLICSSAVGGTKSWRSSPSPSAADAGKAGSCSVSLIASGRLCSCSFFLFHAHLFPGFGWPSARGLQRGSTQRARAKKKDKEKK